MRYNRGTVECTVARRRQEATHLDSQFSSNQSLWEWQRARLEQDRLLGLADTTLASVKYEYRSERGLEPTLEVGLPAEELVITPPPVGMVLEHEPEPEPEPELQPPLPDLQQQAIVETLQSQLAAANAQLLATSADGDCGRQLLQCVICLDEDTVGVRCDGTEPHFVCATCLDAYVDSESKQEPQQVEQRGGQVFCPLKLFHEDDSSDSYACSCDSGAFDDQILARLVQQSTFQSLQTARQHLMETKATREVEAVSKRQLAAKMQELEKLGVEVFKHCQHIREDILTLKCPGCSAAFVDFDGCMALTCASCGAGFCGWCLTHCGKDAHKHVETCTAKPDGARRYYASKEEYEEAWKKRRQKLLDEYCSQQDGLRDKTTRSSVYGQIKQELRAHELTWPQELGLHCAPSACVPSAENFSPDLQHLLQQDWSKYRIARNRNRRSPGQSPTWLGPARC